MNITEWFEAEPGRLSTTARHFGVTLAAVSQWKANGVPRRHVMRMRELTEGQVSLEGMLPGKYQSPNTPTAAEATGAQ